MAYKVVSEITNPTENTYNSWEEFSTSFYKPDALASELRQRIIDNNSIDALSVFERVQKTEEWDTDRQVAIITRIYENFEHYKEREILDANAGINKILEIIIEEGEI